MKFNTFIIILFLVLIYLFLHIGKPLFAPDETRYMEIAREMIASGDYITPKLDGLRYFEKPILGYWVIALSQRLFGVNFFAARLPCVIATILMALLLVALLRKFPDGRKYAWLAAAIFLLMPLPFALAAECSLDALFSFSVTATVVAFYFAVDARENGKPDKYYYWYLIGTGVAAGISFLTKGFLAYALPVCAVLPWLIIRKKWRIIFTAPWIPFFISLIVIAPWAYAIHLEEPDFWRYFIMDEHIKRFLGGEEAQHARSPFFFLGTFAYGTASWLIYLPLMIFGWKKGFIKQSGSIFLLSWALGPFLFLSASSGKLAPYILPCFPAFAALFAIGICRYFDFAKESAEVRKEIRPKYRWFNGLLMAQVILLVIGLPAASLLLGYYLPNFTPDNTLLAHFIKEPFNLYDPTEEWKIAAVVLAGIFTLIALSAAFLEKENPMQKITFVILAYIPLFVASYFIVPNSVYDCRCPMKFLSTSDEDVDQNTVIVAHASTLIHSVCLHFKSTEIFPFFPGELDYGLQYDDKKIYMIRYDQFPKFLADHAGKKVALYFPYDRFCEMQEKGLLPEADSMEFSSPFKSTDRMVKAMYLNTVPSGTAPENTGSTEKQTQPVNG